MLSYLETARAWGYVTRLDDALGAELHQIVGTLVRLVV
jgi:hypothetical protein